MKGTFRITPRKFQGGSLGEYMEERMSEMKKVMNEYTKWFMGNLLRTDRIVYFYQ